MEIEVCGQMVKPQGSNNGEDGGHCKESNSEVDKRVLFAANPIFVTGHCGDTVGFTPVPPYCCAEGQFGFRHKAQTADPLARGIQLVHLKSFICLAK